MAEIIRVGLDFDGVVAYNPFRVARPLVAYVKRKILKIEKLGFFVPKRWWQKLLWIIVHESSVFPAKGLGRLFEMKSSGNYEFHLITGRYGFLKNNLDKWLKRYHLDNFFKSINVNSQQQQPHEFKREIIDKLRLDYYVEDNLDIVRHLKGKTAAQVLWIENILDKLSGEKDGYAYLEKALIKIVDDR